MKKKYSIIGCFVIIIIIMLSLFFSKGVRYDILVKDAYEHISLIRLSNAYLECEEAVSSCPKRMEAYIPYSRIRKLENNKEQAELLLIDALNIARKEYEEKEKVLDGVNDILMELLNNYCEWNEIEKACELIEKCPKELVNDKITEFYNNLVGEKVIITQDYVIEWKDRVFEQVVRQLIGRPQGEIYASDVIDIEQIEIWGNYVVTDRRLVYDYDKKGFYMSGQHYTDKGDIKSLEDLEHFKNLCSLSINYQKELDISAFENVELKRIRKVSLVGNDFYNIQPLMWLNRLTTLYLDYNNISDFLWISRMERLNYLSAMGNRDFYTGENFGAMTGLNELNIMHTPMSDPDLLEDFENLTTLSINGSESLYKLKEISKLTNLTVMTDDYGTYFAVTSTKLKKLKLILTEGSYLKNIQMLRVLEELSIENVGEGITDISQLDSLASLKILKLGAGDYKGYESIARCTSLEKVIIDKQDEAKYEIIKKYFPYIVLN